MKNIQSIFGIEEVLSEINVSFDQPLLSDGYGIDETDIFAKVNSIFSGKKTLIKLHPRARTNRYGEKTY